MSNRNRQNNKRADRKMESNDSPEVPDRAETPEEPDLPSGHHNRTKFDQTIIIENTEP